jgi:hypothetical protein
MLQAQSPAAPSKGVLRTNKRIFFHCILKRSCKGRRIVNAREDLYAVI